ncbi:hypothetical protein IQ268_14960 [Oculatella sp. LEGE 06141]|uniref:hypothetical protein n=1 Tax=Oculatella sp. LEGE 06141 TaxID=1828648 RepID=UPI00187E46B8|nr:hypothetical protein [Oculatella sp. LEGE 06141]MBE9179869.1 hypothetical protein [Oculatella sp. LEGE 06141]
MKTIVYRPALPADYSDILTLHQANLVSNVPDEQRHDGFLSVDMNAEQLAAMHEDLAMIVAVDDASVVGYLGATTIAYNRQIPLLNHMISLYQDTPFQGRSLNEYHSFLYGPVCVATGYRGSGVLQGLFYELLFQVKGQYEVGVAFVAKANSRSLYAHTQKLNMEALREFEFNGNHYLMLAFPVLGGWL